jgi:hypothetical protein
MAITFLTSIPALLLYHSILHDHNYILGTGSAHDWTFLIGPGFCVGVDDFEASFAIYLIVKGFRPSHVLSGEPATT